jgi:hypothetical protein
METRAIVTVALLLFGPATLTVISKRLGLAAPAAAVVVPV